MRKIIFVMLAFGMLQKAAAQDYNSQRSEVLAINLLTNAIIGGIGGAINKGKEEKFYKAFLRNFLKGGVGGLIKYNAKAQCFYFSGPTSNNAYFFVPFSRLCYFLGHSVVMNAAYNKKALDTYYCNFYGIDIRISQNADEKIRARLSLGTLFSACLFAANGGELDLYKSLEYGLLFFNTHDSTSSVASAGYNCVAMRSPANIYLGALSHELVHIYQKYDLFGISAIYDKGLTSRWRERKFNKFMSRYVVADYEPVFMTALYVAQPTPKYYRNYFEFEAQHFASRDYIQRKR